MKVVLQRVIQARVLVEGEIVGAIGKGALLLVGLEVGDEPATVGRAVAKISTLRYFSDEQDRMNQDLRSVGGSLLVISQFTLAASTAKGRRPSFDTALDPRQAEPLFESFVEELRERDIEVATGRFGAAMEVELTNDGPVTFVLDF